MAKDKDVKLWMPLWIGDYLSDTMSLTTEEHGAYLLILMDMWRHKGYTYFSYKNLAKITRLSTQKMKKTWPTLAHFFLKTDDGFLYKNRVMEELQKAKECQNRATERAIKANDARWAKHRQAVLEESLRNPHTGEGAVKGKGIPSFGSLREELSKAMEEGNEFIQDAQNIK